MSFRSTRRTLHHLLFVFCAGVALTLRTDVLAMSGAQVVTGSCDLNGGVVNQYFTPIESVSAGAQSLRVAIDSDSVRGTVSASNVFLLHQTQDGFFNANNTVAYGSQACEGKGWTNIGNAGQWEFVAVEGFDDVGDIRTLHLSSPLRNSYFQSDASIGLGQKRFQVLRVVACETVSIHGAVEGLRWNGLTGGLVALVVTGTLHFDGGTSIIAPAGFRGGGNQVASGANSAAQFAFPAATLDLIDSIKGESICGAPERVSEVADPIESAQGYPGGDYGKGAPCNGGGGGANGRGGGGGGANGGDGGSGGYAWNGEDGQFDFDNARRSIGGAALPRTPLHLNLGGGGGAGQRKLANDVRGGDGGGIIIVQAGSVEVDCSPSSSGCFPQIIADAPPVPSPLDAENAGGGGGGAGGSILAVAEASDSWRSVIFSAKGATGQDASPLSGGSGPGGGGGGGIILLSSIPSETPAVGGATIPSVVKKPQPGRAGIWSVCEWAGIYEAPLCGSLYSRSGTISECPPNVALSALHTCTCPVCFDACGTDACDAISGTCHSYYQDADGDGYTVDQEDCDSDFRQFPGNGEICGNGLDENCDGDDPVCLECLNWMDCLGDVDCGKGKCGGFGAVCAPNLNQLCGEGMVCVGDRCQMPGLMNSPCDALDHNDCYGDLGCGIDGQCGHFGAKCGMDDQLCAQGLHCIEHACRPQSGLLDLCDDYSDCEDGLYCSQSNNVCGGLEAACDTDDDCVLDLVCLKKPHSIGKCVTPQPPGHICYRSADCEYANCNNVCGGDNAVCSQPDGRDCVAMCRPDDPSGDPLCGEVNEMCFSDNNCVGDLNGCGQDEQCGGARANCTTERNCLDEQRCTGDLCKGKEGIGSGCNFNTDCESGLCVGARCAIRRALGQECTSSDECPLNVACSGQCGGIGAACLFNDNSLCYSTLDRVVLCINGKCITPAGACDENSDCLSKQVCIGQKCAPLSELDQSCDDNGDCIGSIGCSPKLKTCGSAQSPCTVPDDCLPNLSCIGNVCQERRDKGGSCTIASDCTGDISCSGTICGGVGAVCGSNLNCLDHLVCSAGVCSNPAGRGGTCVGDDQCMGLLECKQSNCGGLGAACPGNSDALCAPDKRCISSSCSDPGDLGAICEESSDCGNGASCSQVVCGGNGGACAGNSQCLSGACVQSVCSPPSPIGGECDPFDSQDCIGLVSCAPDGTCGEGGAVCSSDDQCVGRCVDGACSLPSPLGGQCSGNTACQIPINCSPVTNTCGGVGAPCNSHDDCIFDCTVNGLCGGIIIDSGNDDNNVDGIDNFEIGYAETYNNENDGGYEGNAYLGNDDRNIIDEMDRLGLGDRADVTIDDIKILEVDESDRDSNVRVVLDPDRNVIDGTVTLPGELIRELGNRATLIALSSDPSENDVDSSVISQVLTLELYDADGRRIREFGQYQVEICITLSPALAEDAAAAEDENDDCDDDNGSEDDETCLGYLADDDGATWMPEDCNVYEGLAWNTLCGRTDHFSSFSILFDGGNGGGGGGGCGGSQSDDFFTGSVYGDLAAGLAVAAFVVIVCILLATSSYCPPIRKVLRGREGEQVLKRRKASNSFKNGVVSDTMQSQETWDAVDDDGGSGAGLVL